jgi:hypothetical protein
MKPWAAIMVISSGGSISALWFDGGGILLYLKAVQGNCLYPYRSELPRGCDKEEGIGVVAVVGMVGVFSDVRQECSSN